MTVSFKDRLFEMANLMRRQSGVPETSDPQAAAIEVLAAILAGSLLEANRPPVKGSFSEADASVAATFLSCLACPLVYHLENEGAGVVLKEVVGKSGLTTFQFLHEEVAIRSIVRGTNEYKRLIQDGLDKPNVKEMVDMINESLFMYVIGGDQRFLKVLGGLFLNMNAAWELD